MNTISDESDGRVVIDEDGDEEGGDDDDGGIDGDGLADGGGLGDGDNDEEVDDQMEDEKNRSYVDEGDNQICSGAAARVPPLCGMHPVDLSRLIVACIQLDLEYE
uniref:Uncharacterized protein n=1 Tax=Panagrolaimus superbus TaxID=310955 RepID=A0A914YHJ8_9BILA